jgi:osmotically-inducible protein OsmY
VGQRHNGEFDREHEARFREQYGGRARDRVLQGRGDEERDERRWTGSRERSDYDPDFGRGYDPGRSGSEYPRFGDRDFSGGRERRDPERGQYAGRGYDPTWERGGYSEQESTRWQRGGYEPSYDESPGGREPRGSYGGSASREQYRDRSFEDQRRFGGRGYQESGGRFGGAARSFGDPERSSRYGRGFGTEEGFPGSERRVDHAGRGPKDYRRSDERIREEVCDRLTADSDVDASELTVIVKDCEVTLEGTVDSRWMKRRAEDSTEDVPGVTQVHNRLQIRSSGEWNRETGASRSGNAEFGANPKGTSQH